MFRAPPRRGFTLIELLVVIAIIAVLIGLLLPAIQKVREAANRSTCQNNLKQLATGSATFESANGAIIPAYLTDQWATWAVFVLPHIEQGAVFQQWDTGKRYYEQPAGARQTNVKTFFCPSRRGGAVPLSSGADTRSSPPAYGDTPGARSDYAVCYGNTAYVRGEGATVWVNNGAHVPNFSIGNTDYVNYRLDHRVRDIIDGTSNTVMYGEKHIPLGTAVGDGSVFNGDYQLPNIRLLGYSGTKDPVTGRYTNEYPLVADARENTTSSGWQFGGIHPGTAIFSFADGSVRSVRTTASLETLNRLSVRNDGLPLGDDL